MLASGSSHDGYGLLYRTVSKLNTLSYQHLHGGHVNEAIAILVQSMDLMKSHLKERPITPQSAHDAVQLSQTTFASESPFTTQLESLHITGDESLDALDEILRAAHSSKLIFVVLESTELTPHHSYENLFAVILYNTAIARLLLSVVLWKDHDQLTVCLKFVQMAVHVSGGQSDKSPTQLLFNPKELALRLLLLKTTALLHGLMGRPVDELGCTTALSEIVQVIRDHGRTFRRIATAAAA